MKPFDLKAAMSGSPVTIENSRSVYRIDEAVIGKSGEPSYLEFKLVGKLGGLIKANLDGVCTNSGMQLVMAPVKVKKTINVRVYEGGVASWSSVEEKDLAIFPPAIIVLTTEIEIEEAEHGSKDRGLRSRSDPRSIGER